MAKFGIGDSVRRVEDPRLLTGGGRYTDDTKLSQPAARLYVLRSPHAHAKGMKTPTLVIHGAMDYRVPDAQGLAYYNTLKARHVDARLLWFPDENHWILKPRNSQVWYREFFAWLRHYDPAAPKARGQRVGQRLSQSKTGRNTSR